MAKVLHVQKEDWKGIESNEKLVLVDFWADWCGPCRALAPTFEKLAEAFGNDIVFAKVNVDELPELADKFRIRSIPTLILLRSGNAVEQFVGFRSYEELATILARHIAAPANR
jgi:thioredoxin